MLAKFNQTHLFCLSPWYKTTLNVFFYTANVYIFEERLYRPYGFKIGTWRPEIDFFLLDFDSTHPRDHVDTNKFTPQLFKIWPPKVWSKTTIFS